jgi:hypothetical protein
MKELDDSEFVTNAFSALNPVEASPALMRKVACIPLEHAGSEAWIFWPFKHLWQPSLALACAALLGFVSGDYLPSGGPSDESLLSQNELTVAIEATDDTESEGLGDELDGLLALATASELAWGLEPDASLTTTPGSKSP